MVWVVESLRIEISALEIGDLSDNGASHSHEFFKLLVTKDNLVIVCGCTGDSGVIAPSKNSWELGAWTEANFGGSMSNE